MNTQGPQRIATSVDFKTHAVEQDYADYKRSPVDLRLAYHLALSLFHLRDWTFWEHGNNPNWQYSEKIGDYQKDLEDLCPEFGYMRDLANAVKHAELSPNKKPSTQMVGLANTEIAQAGFQSPGFQSSGFQTRTYIVSEIGPANYVDFEKAADAVKRMWDGLFVNNAW